MTQKPRYTIETREIGGGCYDITIARDGKDIALCTAKQTFPEEAVAEMVRAANVMPMLMENLKNTEILLLALNDNPSFRGSLAAIQSTIELIEEAL